MIYLNNSKLFISKLNEYVNPNFTMLLCEAINKSKPLNYNDEYPRYIIHNAELTDSHILLLFTQISTTISIDLNTFTITQCNSAFNKFQLTDKQNIQNYLTIIFEC